MQNIYEGWRKKDGSVIVTVNAVPLESALGIRNHSPTGFEWGYGGSGPAQLALAILTHEYGKEIAQDFYQRFKWAYIATLPQEKSWMLKSDQIETIIRRIRSEEQSRISDE